MAETSSAISRTGQLDPPKRLLLGPGPSEVDPVVLEALSLPPLGHLDPALLAIMADTQEMLRAVFRTTNRFTIALSGTGTSGMEAALLNSVEPEARVVIGVMGYFGDRMCEIATRIGASVTRVDAPWGQPLNTNKMRDAILSTRPSVVCAVHAETSTGVCQDLPDIADAAHEVDALFLVDAVTSLGGQPVLVDEWGIDVCYSGSQKCLGAPSGLAPFTMNERALERLRRRKNPIPGFYLDALLLAKYWEERQYHHTISAPLIYALYTALQILHDEGLEARWERHRTNHVSFRTGIEAMGLEFLPEEQYSLWPLNAIMLPDYIDETAVRTKLLTEYGIEIGGGLGPLRGKLLRVGLMGYGSRNEYVVQLLDALDILLRQGQRHPD